MLGHVECRWCGAITQIGAACDVCGSPLAEARSCRYCRAPGWRDVCIPCSETLVRMWGASHEDPESRFLFADVP